MEQQQMMSLMQIGSIVVIFVVFYFLLIRPQKKREKEAVNMRSNLEVGDEIVTVGGVVGTVVSMRDESLVIETGSDRSKVRIMRWAVQSNNTPRTSTPAKK